MLYCMPAVHLLASLLLEIAVHVGSTLTEGTTPTQAA